MSNWTIPGGRSKGTPVNEAESQDLEYWVKRIGKELDDGNARNPDRDGALHKAMTEELASRKGGNGQQPAAKPASTALAPRDPAEITGSLRDPAEITKRMQIAAEHYHLVSPAPACPALPEGCSIMLSMVVIDPDTEGFDVGGGKIALAKSALEKLAAGAGISWDAQQSHRIDDSSDPHYCNWQAVGTLRHLDGTAVQLVGCKEMDLRESSAQLEALGERYRTKYKKWEKDGRKGYEPKDPEGQIREMRLHIQAHAESKARLRAIRSIGIRPSYALKEFQKPFVVARLMWTGQSDCPELRKAFALKQADAMIGGTKALYGDTPAAPAIPATTQSPPPPVNSTSTDDRYDYDVPPEDSTPDDSTPDERQEGMDY